MQKILYILSCFSICLVSCETPKEVALNHVSGYWEIDKVISLNGKEKPYKFNVFVDYFKVENDSIGFRKKLKPSFKGTYKGNNILQRFKITKRNDTILFTYKNQQTSWEEQLVEASANLLVLKNRQGIHFIYKPFTPITIE